MDQHLDVASDECVLMWVCPGFESQTGAWFQRVSLHYLRVHQRLKSNQMWTYTLCITYWYTYVWLAYIYSIPSVHSIVHSID